MKIGIYGGEAFPVYEIHEEGFTEIEVTEETLKRWQSVCAEFVDMQEEIIECMKAQGHSDEIWSNGIYDPFKIDLGEQ
jgi:hypothetical protein